MSDLEIPDARLFEMLDHFDVSKDTFKSILYSQGIAHEKTVAKWLQDRKFGTAHAAMRQRVAGLFSLREDIFDIPQNEYERFMGERFGEGAPGLFRKHNPESHDFVGEFMLLRFAWSAYEDPDEEQRTFRFPWLIQSRLTVFNIGKEKRFICVEPANPFKGGVDAKTLNAHLSSTSDRVGFRNSITLSTTPWRKCRGPSQVYVGAMLGTVPADGMAIGTTVVAAIELDSYLRQVSGLDFVDLSQLAQRVGHLPAESAAAPCRVRQLLQHFNLVEFFLERDGLPEGAPNGSLQTRSTLIRHVV